MYLPAGGVRESRARSIRAKAMEAVKILDRGRDELPGVWSSERADGDGGNWGDPPRPGGVRCDRGRLGRRGWCCRSAAPYNRKTGSGLLAGRESEAAVVLVICREQNLRGGKGRCFVHARLKGCGR